MSLILGKRCRAVNAMFGNTGLLVTRLRFDEGQGPSERGQAVEVDTNKIDDAVLALLLLGQHEKYGAWKGFDWEALDRLYAKGMISNPKSKAKSVSFIVEGLAKAEELFKTLFAAQ